MSRLLFRLLTTSIAVVAMSVAAVAPAAHAGDGARPVSANPTQEGIVPLGGECGSSYGLVGLYPVQNDLTDRLEGYMEIYYSSTLRRNCAIMRHAGLMWGVRTSFPTGTFVEIRASGGSWQNCPLGQTTYKTQCDRGRYYYYAGPVYTPAGVNMSGRCVDFNGNVGLATHISRSGKHCG